MSGLESGANFDRILSQLDEYLAKHPLPEGVAMERGGLAEGAGDANASMLRVFPIGLLAIVMCLLIEFRSFRRMAIIMATVPLCAVGIVPGLVLSGEPFGFMSLLGVIALSGIVVNNAIVLLDRVERRRADGLPVEDKMIQLDTPIRELGVLTINVKITPDTKAVTRVWIVQEAD